jgi:hypothetical protein
MSSFLQRLDIYTTIPPTTPMTDILVKWLVELLSILALVTKQVEQGRWSESALPDTSHGSTKSREIWKEVDWR